MPLFGEPATKIIECRATSSLTAVAFARHQRSTSTAGGGATVPRAFAATASARSKYLFIFA